MYLSSVSIITASIVEDNIVQCVYIIGNLILYMYVEGLLVYGLKEWNI